jgi:hypothetical protein
MESKTTKQIQKSYRQLQKKIEKAEQKVTELRNQLSEHFYVSNNEKTLIKNVITNLRKYCKEKQFKNYEQIIDDIEKNMETAPRIIKYSIPISGKYETVYGDLQACFYKYNGKNVFFHVFDIQDRYFVEDFTQSNYCKAEWTLHLPDWIINHLPLEKYEEFRENVNYETWEEDKDLKKLLPEVNHKTFIDIILTDDNDEENLFDIGNDYVLFSNLATDCYLLEGDKIPSITKDWEINENFKSKEIIKKYDE